MRAAVSRHLEILGCTVLATDSVGGALNAVEHQSFDMAFVDPHVEVESGRDLGSRLVDEVPEMTLVLLAGCTAFGSIVSERLAAGRDHLPTTFTPAQIKHIVEKFCEARALRQRVADCERHRRLLGLDDDMVAESPAMRGAMALAAKLAQDNRPVVIGGEWGTGRMALARFVHGQSSHAKGPFVAFNLLGMSEDGSAVELFGHGRGVLAGRRDHRPGLVEEAKDGTLFLDGIAGMAPVLRTRLARLLSDGEFERVGELRVRRSNVRLVASTEEGARSWASLGDEWRQIGIAFAHIAIPPLRERRADVVALARKFLGDFARSMRRGRMELTAAAERALAAYDWPGNIPELRNAVERAVILCRAATVDAGDFPQYAPPGREEAPTLGGDFTVEEILREHVRRVASRAGSDRAATKILGISRSTLWRRREGRSTSDPPSSRPAKGRHRSAAAPGKSPRPTRSAG